VANPQDAKPSANLLKILKALKLDRRNEVVIISGRDSKTLDKWLGQLDISMVAEHGAYVKTRSRAWKPLRPVSKSWKEEVRHKIEPYVDWLPGSTIEEKACSIVWHYRNADPELGRVLEMELLDDLTHFTSNMDLQVMQGNKIVEIRVAGVNKGAGGLSFVSQKNYDFILSIGDDWTDEDLFKVLPDEAFSIRVGITQSHAKYNVQSTTQVHELLAEFNRLDAKVKTQRETSKMHEKEVEELVVSS
jgi:trehalose 6-phosphate synthase/phosphatase